MRHFQWVFISCLFTLFACDGVITDGQGNVVLPPSSGGLDEVLVVISQPLEDTIGKYIDAFLERDYQILPQPERTLAASSVSYGEMNDLLRHFRTIIFVGHMQEDNATSKLFKASLKLEGSIAKPIVKSFNNVWANDQVVHFIIDNDYESLVKTVEKELPGVSAKIEFRDLQGYRDIELTNGYNINLKNEMLADHGFEVTIPNDYREAYKDDDFIWLRKDEAGKKNRIISNIVIGVIDLGNEPFENKAIAVREYFGATFIETATENDKMLTDTIFGLLTRKLKMKGMTAYENRGLWTMEKEIMGGPFINYFIHDEKNNQAIFVEGFVFAPSERKRLLMRKLESVLTTVNVPES